MPHRSRRAALGAGRHHILATDQAPPAVAQRERPAAWCPRFVEEALDMRRIERPEQHRHRLFGSKHRHREGEPR
jgi:hypothetical protein